MAISFTDEQVKNISKDILLIPFVIDDPVNGTGFVQQKAKILVAKDSNLVTDQGQEVFTNFWDNVVKAYHNELKYLTAVERTTYPISGIDEGAKEKGPHWPSNPIWTSLIPKILDSNNGNPRPSITFETESERIAKVQNNIGILKNGFNYGTFDYPATSISGNTLTMAPENTGLAIGQMIVIGDSSTSAIAEITNYVAGSVGDPMATPNPIPATDSIITFEVKGGTLPSGTPNVKNYISAISNSKRGRQTSLSSDELAILLTLESVLNEAVDNLESCENDQKGFVSGNEDTQPRKASNQTEVTNLQTALDAIATWKALPLNDINGKSTNAGLQPLEDAITARSTQSTNRGNEVSTNLGSIAQDGSGNVTGDGAYFDSWKFVNLRISKGTGTRNQYYALDIGVVLFDKKIADANTQLEQYSNIFALSKIKVDTVISQDVFDVESSSDFAVGNEVKVMDNDSVVYTRTIDAIDGTEITLNQAIPIALSKSKLARIVKYK